MKRAGRFAGGLALLVSLILIPVANAADKQLQKATDLFNGQQYVAAQKALLKVDRDKLDEADARAYDALLKILPDAIDGSKRSQQDIAAANNAFREGRWQKAGELYAKVLDNQYAPQALRDQANAQQKRLAQKVELSEAARPAGPVAVADVQASKQSRQTRQSPGITIEDVPGSASRRPAPVSRSRPAAAPATVSNARPAPRPAARSNSSQVVEEDVNVTPRRSTAAVQRQPQAANQAANQPATTPPSMAPTTPPASAAPRRRTLVDDMRARDELLWQRARAKMEEAVKKAGAAVAAEDFGEARQWAESAIQVIEANRAYAQPPSKYEAARSVALELRKSVKQAQADYDLRKAADQRAEIAEKIEQRRRSQEQQRQEKIEQLFATAQQLQKEQRYSEAAEAMRTVLAIDPANANASFKLDMYDDFASLLAQKDVAHTIRGETRRLLQKADETRIPWTQDILYPKNWMEIVTRRSGVQDTVGPGEDFELNRILESTQEEINFEETPLDQAINFLTELNDLNVAVDWEDLARSGIDRDKPVSLRLREVSLRTVLNEVLSQVGGDVPLRFTVGEGLLRIATKEKLDRDKYTLVYDIRDLIVDIPHFAAKPLLDTGGAGGWVSGSPVDRSSLFGDRRSEGMDQGSMPASPSEKIVSKIMDIIRQNTEPDSWRETGGGDASLRELNGQLIVYATSEAHQQTRALLDQLRDARALMIVVESRFLVVSSNFLEEMGVDLDFVFNSGSASFDPAFNAQGAPVTDPFSGAQVLIPRQFSRAGVFPAVPALGGGAFPSVTPQQPYGHAGYVPTGTGIIPQLNDMSPITAQQSSLSLADPRTINTGIPGTLATQALSPALNIAGSFLDNLQVDFLIRATQANRRSSIVQAPRLMMFNGQRAYVAVTRTRQYVSSVTPSVAEGAVGVQPVQAAATSGTTLDVQGTISADRKYVTITVRTDRSGEPSFERFEVQRASGNSPGIFILLPDQDQTTIRTTVSVPDGGTVLMGGLKQVGEVEIEAGVPILSKIPVLKRAFTNKTEVKDTQTLLILLKAKILIQKEAEEDAFPTLTSLQPG